MWRYSLQLLKLHDANIKMSVNQINVSNHVNAVSANCNFALALAPGMFCFQSRSTAIKTMNGDSFSRINFFSKRCTKTFPCVTVEAGKLT